MTRGLSSAKKARGANTPPASGENTHVEGWTSRRPTAPIQSLVLIPFSKIFIPFSSPHDSFKGVVFLSG